MMSVRIASKHLVGLLKDLVLTAGDDVEVHGSLAGVLLHSARAAVDAEPGKRELLVGTSSNRFAIGHCWAYTEGSLPAMLWWVDDVRSVVAVLGPKSKVGKDEPDHVVSIRPAPDGMVEIVEDPDQRPMLLDTPWSMKFRLGPIDDYPRSLWFALQQGDRVLDEPVLDRDLGEVPPLPRVDFQPEFLAPFAAIAKRRKANVEAYIRHHRRLVHIQIGDHYRGAISPTSYPDGPSQRAEGMTPGLEVLDPGLPPRPEKPDPNGPAPVDLDAGEEVLGPLATALLDAQVEVDAPAGSAVDLGLLEMAARVVITAESGSRSMLQRNLKVGKETVGRLLDRLEELGVVGPSDGSVPREVLVPAVQLDAVVAQIRSGAS
jgi:hypothetical protein